MLVDFDELTILDGIPSNIKESINLIPFCDGINRTDLLNIIMTIPLGIGMPFVTGIKSMKRMMILGLGSGIFLETMQYLEAFLTGGFTLRIIDVNDVICNFAGAIIGFLVLYAFSRLYIKLKEYDLNAFWKYVYKTCASIRLN